MCTNPMSSPSRSSVCRLSWMYAVTCRSLDAGRPVATHMGRAASDGVRRSDTYVRQDVRVAIAASPCRHIVTEPLSEKQPGAVYARLHVRDADAQGLADLATRQPFDIVQDERRAIRRRQLVDRRGQRRSQLGLKGRVLHAWRPIVAGLDVRARLIEERQDLVQREIRPSDAPTAELLVGGVRDDPIEPGAEGRLPFERLDLPDHAPERVLHDLLGIRVVSRDTDGEAVRAVSIGGHELLRRGRLATPEGDHERTITIDPRRSHLRVRVKDPGNPFNPLTHLHVLLAPDQPSLPRFQRNASSLPNARCAPFAQKEASRGIAVPRG